MNVNKAVHKKPSVNGERYPVERTAGLGRKYHALQE
jgi:hypothetical protein